MKRKNFLSQKSFSSLLFLAFVELAEFVANIASPIPVIGQVGIGLASILGFVITLLFQIYIYMKGVKKLWPLMGNIIDAIPLLSILPTKLGVWIAVVLVSNNKMLSKAVDKVPGKGMKK